MILDEYIETKIASSNKEHYKNLGYDISNIKIPILVKVCDLLLNSHIKINVKCDVCGELMKMSYQNYNKNTNNQTEMCTCIKCKSIKSKKTCLEKYGCEYSTQSKEIRDKTKQTNIERYGTDMPLKNPEIKKKAEKTCEEKYGVKNVFANEEIKQKIKNTIKEKYSVDYIGQAEFIRNKITKTNIERYGSASALGNKDVQEKAKQTLKKHYNVETPMQSPEIKNKVIETNMNKYGVAYTLQAPEIREKGIQTSLLKYGTKSPMQSSEIQAKAVQTNLKRYNVEYTMQCPEIREKAIQTNIERYGVANPTENPNISSKIRKKCYENGAVPTSIQQLYLYNLYGGILNYPLGIYSLDILIPEYNIDIEYNGGGHNLKVKMGNMTEEEFNRREIIRGKSIRQSGIKQMIIISETDKLSSDEILLNMLNIAKDYLLNTEHTWIEFNIDKNIVRNAVDGISFFDYGELRKIKNRESIVNGGEIYHG